jgi:hypothetical protein
METELAIMTTNRFSVFCGDQYNIIWGYDVDVGCIICLTRYEGQLIQIVHHEAMLVEKKKRKLGETEEFESGECS